MQDALTTIDKTPPYNLGSDWGKEIKRPLNRRIRIVELAPETLSDGRLAGSDKLDMNRANQVTRSITIRASAERCFELISKQLEEVPNWDPTIMWVNPIKQKHVRVGSMSRVDFSLNGMKEEAVAMIRSFLPNKSILWTSNHSSHLQEQWQLESEPDGTLATVTLGYNHSSSIFGRLIDKIAMKSKVEAAVSEMLKRLKIAAESTKAT